MELEFLQQLIAEALHVDRREVIPETRFTEDLGADSLDLFQIFTKTEEKFAIRVPDDRWHSVRTVGDVIELIRESNGTEPEAVG